jgi:hypothetical protein
MILVTKIKILKDQIYRSQVMIAIKIITKIYPKQGEITFFLFGFSKFLFQFHIITTNDSKCDIAKEAAYCRLSGKFPFYINEQVY